MSDDILLSIDGGLARVTLNRPERLNAIGSEAATRWRDIAIEVTSRDDVGAVIIDASGPAFCAGGDVREMAGSGMGGDGVAALADTIHQGMLAFQRGSVPIVAAVQGAVAGGGLGFMLVADYIVASGSASFQSKYADIGLTPDCGVSTLLPEAVGVRRALRLTLTGLRLTTPEALEWGLVDEVAEPDSLAGRAAEIAEGWLAGATGAYGQARRLIRAGAGRSFADGLDDEAATIGAAFDTAEASARIAAFAGAGKGSR